MEKKFCMHVYEYVHTNICPLCGKNTHEPDWALYMKQRKEHREKYGVLYNETVWWSI